MQRRGDAPPRKPAVDDNAAQSSDPLAVQGLTDSSRRKNNPPRSVSSVSGDNPKERLLEAARHEFAQWGFEGARVDRIAAAARTNKRMIYEYFGSKEALYGETVRLICRQIISDESHLAEDLNRLDPCEAIFALAGHFFRNNDESVVNYRLLVDVNLRGVGLGSLLETRSDFARIVALFANILHRGATLNIFRQDLDAVEVLISLLSVCSIRFNNAPILSFLFDIDLNSAEGQNRSRIYAIELTIRSLLTPHAMNRRIRKNAENTPEI